MSSRRIACVVTLCITWLLGCSANIADNALKETADGFLLSLSQHDYEKARRYLTSELKEKTPTANFEQFSVYTGLDENRSHTWESPNVRGDEAELIGSFRQDNAARGFPLRLTFNEQHGSWRIAAIERGVFIGTSGDDAVFAPNSEQCIRLAQTTTAAFANAVRNKDLDGFRTNASPEFQNHFSKETFNRAFGSFIRDRINIGPAAKLSPVFTEMPSLRPDGTLKLVGFFPSQPSRVSFVYEYTSRRRLEWVVSGISIDVKPVSKN